ncbi:hypothetical protein KY285_036915 [Solanum tuberosum]|nr:hypothetical protein KY285_036915 [Solanum tuberosum]
MNNITTDFPAEIESPNQKRWHLALATIYCSRAFKTAYSHGSPAYNPKKVLSVSTDTIAIDVSQQHPFFSDINYSSLAKLVKDKNGDELANLGGVQGVAASLKSDTTNGTNDAPALKEADIGLSMGIQGTEVAKESSDIVILDANYASVATVLKWGRCFYINIQKFIQFQLTENVAALMINFVAAVSSGEVPLTAVQLLWVNLIMDTLGALALATEKPTEELMKKKPVGRTAPLITNIMWRNLMAQALYQIAVLLTLQFKGEFIFSSDGYKDYSKELGLGREERKKRRKRRKRRAIKEIIVDFSSGVIPIKLLVVVDVVSCVVEVIVGCGTGLGCVFEL